MNSDTRFIAISQRVVELSDRGETRDCLDQAWSAWVQSLGFLPLPVPNKIASVREFLNSIPLAGIILSGGNNLALPVYAGEMNGKIVTDAFESRDQTEQALVDFSLQKNIPVSDQVSVVDL